MEPGARRQKGTRSQALLRQAHGLEKRVARQARGTWSHSPKRGTRSHSPKRGTRSQQGGKVHQEITSPRASRKGTRSQKGGKSSKSQGPPERAPGARILSKSQKAIQSAPLALARGTQRLALTATPFSQFFLASRGGSSTRQKGIPKGPFWPLFALGCPFWALARLSFLFVPFSLPFAQRGREGGLFPKEVVPFAPAPSLFEGGHWLVVGLGRGEIGKALGPAQIPEQGLNLNRS